MGTTRDKQAIAVRDALAHLELAPFDASHWPPALKAMAEASNGWLGQVLALGPARPFTMYSEPFEDCAREWMDAGGADAANPLISAGMKLRQSFDFAEREIMADAERRRHPLLGDFYPRKGVPYLCVSHAAEIYGERWFAVTMSSARQGSIGEAERGRFRGISRSVGHAVRKGLAIRNEGARLLAGAFNALSITAFVHDAFGRVVAMSRKAEAMVCEGDILRLRRSSLLAQTEAATMALEDAVLRGVRHCPGSAPDRRRRVALADACGSLVATAQIIPLPRERCDVGMGATAVSIVEELPKKSVSALAKQFGLTQAETEIASLLLQRLRPKEIAHRRHVSYETVRTQTKAVYAKFGVNSQFEFTCRFDSQVGQIPI